MNESREAVEAAEALAAVPAFGGLTPLDRAKLAAFLEERWLDAGTVVFEAGSEGDALYIVRAGVAEPLGERLLVAAVPWLVLRVSSKAFGAGRRLPIVHRYAL